MRESAARLQVTSAIKHAQRALGPIGLLVVASGLGMTTWLVARYGDYLLAIVLMVLLRLLPYIAYLTLAIFLRRRQDDCGLPIAATGLALLASDLYMTYRLVAQPASSTDAVLSVVAPVVQIVVLMPITAALSFSLQRIFRR